LGLLMRVWNRVAQTNHFVCSMISDNPVPRDFKVSETDPKNKLQPALQSSFDFCSHAVTTLQDSKWRDSITFFGGQKTPRARFMSRYRIFRLESIELARRTNRRPV
jgi:hypothetical protein